MTTLGLTCLKLSGKTSQVGIIDFSVSCLFFTLEGLCIMSNHLSLRTIPKIKKLWLKSTFIQYMQSANQASALNSISLGVLMGWESHP